MSSVSGSDDDSPAVSTDHLRYGAALFVAADLLCQQATEECDARAELATKGLIEQVKFFIIYRCSHGQSVTRNFMTDNFPGQG